jgi:hypothetical protein
MAFGRELAEWHDFYLLVGTAGATLLALLFVAVSLAAGYLTEESKAGTRTFMSPVVLHFGAVFFLSAIGLVPALYAPVFAAIVGVTALIGIVVSSIITVWVIRTEMTSYVEDYFAYGLLPAFAYLLLLTAAVLIWRESDIGLAFLAGSLLLLALINIRNAWDLTLTMMWRHKGPG